MSAEDEAETPANSGNTNAPAEPAKQPEQETQKPANEQPPAEAQKPEETAKPAEPEKPTEPEIVYQYKNGTFSGSGEGFEGTITVNVTIENDKITNISVVSASDDEPYWSESKGIISRIISCTECECGYSKRCNLQFRRNPGCGEGSAEQRKKLSKQGESGREAMDGNPFDGAAADRLR